MSKDFNGVCSKRIIVYIHTFFIVLFAHSVIFAMDSSKNNIYTQLWEYAQSDQTLSDLKDILKNNDLDINATNAQHQTILHIAASHGAEFIVSYLLLDLKDQQVSKPSDSDINSLSNLKIEIDAQDIKGYPALHLAIINSHLKVARMLLNAGAKLSVEKARCRHALYFAAEYAKNKEFVKFIIEESKNAQFDINALADDEHYYGRFGSDCYLDYLGQNPLTIAIRAENRAALEALLEARAKIMHSDYRSIYHSAGMRNEKLIRNNIVKNKQDQMNNQKNQTILHIAALHGVESIVSYLLDLRDHQISKSDNYHSNDLGVEIDASDAKGYTSLYLAINYRHLNVARMLLSAGAKLSVEKARCRHALYCAAVYVRDKEFLKLIIKKSKKAQFDINALADTDEDRHDLICYGKNSFMVASLSGNRAAVEALLEAEAQITQKSATGEYALNYAACSINPAEEGQKLFLFILQKSKNAGIDVDTANENGITPLMLVCSKGCRAAVEALLEAGAKITQKDIYGNYPLHHAVYAENKNFIQFIIEKSKNAQIGIDIQNDYHWTALMKAVNQGNEAAIEALLEAGASVHAINTSRENTSLHIAIESFVTCIESHNRYHTKIDFEKNKKVIRLLLKAGANIYSLDNQQITPLRIAFNLACKYHSAGVSTILIELLSWCIYQGCTMSIPPEHMAILQSIKKSYLDSEDAQALRQSNPLLEWIFNQLIDCTSKKQIIEKLLEYLETADEEQQHIMIKNMDYLLLKEDLLKEFNLNLNTFKRRFSSVEKLKSIFRYLYAQKVQKEIFSNFSEDFNAQLMNLTALKKGTQSDLKTAKEFIIKYCKNDSFESPLLRAFLVGNDSSQLEKMVDLAECLGSNLNPDKSILVSEKAVFRILDKRIDDVFQFIKDMKLHLNYIIEKKGTCLKSNTRFGEKENTDKNKDILIFTH